jgi:lipopolysaccharide transport protein LptA
MSKTILILTFALFCVNLSAADDQDELNTSWAQNETNCTVITSDVLEFDQPGGLAVFKGNVNIKDFRINIQTDQMTVKFKENQGIKQITADGNVVIKRENIIGYGEHAEYFADEGKAVLTKNPRIERGKDVLVGETITLWRDSGKIICEPNAVLKLYPEETNGNVLKLDD